MRIPRCACQGSPNRRSLVRLSTHGVLRRKFLASSRPRRPGTAAIAAELKPASHDASAAHAVIAQLAAEVGLIGFEMCDSLRIGEVVQVVGLGRVDACEQSRLAGIADRPWRKSSVVACIEWSLQ